MDITGTLRFLCSNLRVEMVKIKKWTMEWFTILLKIPELNIPAYIPFFFK